jgi:hypothetical protein
MSGDEELIERITLAMRLEVNGVSPSAAPLERVVASGVWSRRRFAGIGTFVPVLSGVAALAIAVVAAATLNHRHGGAARGRVGPGRGFAAALAASDREPVAPALLRHFAVLRSPAYLTSNLTAARVTVGIERALIEPLNPYGLNLAATHFVPYFGAPSASPNGLSGVWIVPGRTGLALLYDSLRVGGDWGLSDGAESPLTGRVRMARWYGDGSQTIVGLVPDGNRRVTVLVRGGRRVSAPVVENVYSIYAPPHAVALLVKDTAGRTVRIPFAGG